MAALFFHTKCAIGHSTSRGTREAIFPHPGQLVSFSVSIALCLLLFVNSIPHRYEGCHCGFDVHSPNDWQCISSSKERQFKSFGCFLIRSFFFFYGREGVLLITWVVHGFKKPWNSCLVFHEATDSVCTYIMQRRAHRHLPVWKAPSRIEGPALAAYLRGGGFTVDTAKPGPSMLLDTARYHHLTLY